MRRKAASIAKRTRADGRSAQRKRPSLPLLFTLILGRRLAPFVRAEEDPPATRPCLRRTCAPRLPALPPARRSPAPRQARTGRPCPPRVPALAVEPARARPQE